MAFKWEPKQRRIIAVDFDGTIVEHRFPAIGPRVPLAIESLKELQKEFSIILWTCRNNQHLLRALEFCLDRGVRIDSVNDNPNQKFWASGPKLFADYYIDDRGVGTPLIHPGGDRKPYVDWKKVMKLIERKE